MVYNHCIWPSECRGVIVKRKVIVANYNDFSLAKLNTLTNFYFTF